MVGGGELTSLARLVVWQQVAQGNIQLVQDRKLCKVGLPAVRLLEPRIQQCTRGVSLACGAPRPQCRGITTSKPKCQGGVGCVV